MMERTVTAHRRAKILLVARGGRLRGLNRRRHRLRRSAVETDAGDIVDVVASNRGTTSLATAGLMLLGSSNKIDSGPWVMFPELIPGAVSTLIACNSTAGVSVGLTLWGELSFKPNKMDSEPTVGFSK